MHVLVTGAAGMIGAKLATRLLAEARVGPHALARLTLHDVVAPRAPQASGEVHVETLAADIGDPATAVRLVAERPDVIVHLAAVVSGEAEADFDKGYAINLDGTRALLEAIRAVGEGYRPRVVFASSLAVFGAPLPDVVPEGQALTPATSYGTQKAIGELLLADYTRRGILDGIGIRLPTICVRPGRPNKAASSFFSSIVREPLVGAEAVLPVPDDVRHWLASPRAAVGFLLHAAALDGAALGTWRTLDMPGVSVTVAEQIAALGRVAGPAAVARIRRVPDPAITRIIEAWPRAFAPERALALGFRAEASFEEIIRVHIDDELGGRIPG